MLKVALSIYKVGELVVAVGILIVERRSRFPLAIMELQQEPSMAMDKLESQEPL